MPFDSPFNALRRQFRIPRYQITDTQEVDATAGTLAVGQFRIAANSYPKGTDFKFTATFQVSNGALVGTVLLYNVTDGEVVSATTLATSSTIPDGQVSLSIPVGTLAGNLKLAAKIYEVRLSVTGGFITDVVSLGSAALASI